MLILNTQLVLMYVIPFFLNRDILVKIFCHLSKKMYCIVFAKLHVIITYCNQGVPNNKFRHSSLSRTKVVGI